MLFFDLILLLNFKNIFCNIFCVYLTHILFPFKNILFYLYFMFSLNRYVLKDTVPPQSSIITYYFYPRPTAYLSLFLSSPMSHLTIYHTNCHGMPSLINTLSSHVFIEVIGLNMFKLNIYRINFTGLGGLRRSCRLPHSINQNKTVCKCLIFFFVCNYSYIPL